MGGGRHESLNLAYNKNFLDYTLFVSFFPQLIAGPIVHHRDMIPQFCNLKNKILNYKNISLGLFIFSIGLFKKVVIADSLSVYVSYGFDTSDTLSFIEAWTSSLSYTFQLYFDFSGYCDMAVGIALLFNIKLPVNFNSPYKSLNIQEFWRSWHITLGKFLKDYVYIPLGGNKKGEVRVCLNLMITFLIGGIWHGASWTFVFWGFLHGLALVVYRLWSKVGFRLNKIVAWFITFNFVNVSWLFFRAKEWEDAIKLLKGMLGLDGFILPNSLRVKFLFLENLNLSFGSFNYDIKRCLFMIILSGFLVLCFKNSTRYLANPFQTNYKNLLLFVACFSISILSMYKISEFLYFNF